MFYKEADTVRVRGGEARLWVYGYVWVCKVHTQMHVYVEEGGRIKNRL